MNLDDLQMYNLHRPTNTHLSAGQPTASQLRDAAAAGVRHVINLRPEAEDAGFDEPALLAELGLTHTRVAVNGAAGLTESNVAALDAALGAAGDAPTLLHCAGANRVGALMALRANWLHGTNAEESLKVGKAYGLSGLEGAVRQLLR